MTPIPRSSAILSEEMRVKISGVARSGRVTNRIAVWALAIFLPLISSAITSHVAILHNTPFALHVLSIIFVAMVGGLGPAALGILASIFSNYIVLGDVVAKSEPLRVSVLRAVILIIIGLFVSVMNNSRRRALASLEERTEELILSQQGGRCASWRYDRGRGIRWQRGGFEVFGISFDELEKLNTPLSLIHPEDQQRVQTTIEELVATGSPGHLEYRVIFPNGDLHWSETRIAPINGGKASWHGVSFDITESKLAENALLRSEKLAAMGRLASTVAHEINNPLEAVTNLLYLARTDQSMSTDSQSYLASAEVELARLGEITRLTLGFVRNNSSALNLDPIKTVDEVLSIFRHRFETRHIQVNRTHQPGLSVRIVPHELRQIVTNLISNASDAVGGADARLSIQMTREQNIVVLLIEDNGSGIADADAERIFEPFFSTKQDVGTGIGLWVTRELVEKNGGAISVRSGDLPGGMKTSFRIEFPLAA
jgi:PAS domain S-box-containing protein